METYRNDLARGADTTTDNYLTGLEGLRVSTNNEELAKWAKRSKR